MTNEERLADCGCGCRLCLESLHCYFNSCDVTDRMTGPIGWIITS